MKTLRNKKSLNERLKILQQAFDLFSKKELELIKDNNSVEFNLNPLPNDSAQFRNITGEKVIKLKKYVLQGNGTFDSVGCKTLEEDSLLQQEISKLIKAELGNNYVTIFCKEFDRYLGQQDMFGVKFYSIFSKGQSGRITFDKTRTSDREPSLSINSNKVANSSIEVSIDIVYKKVMTYTGDETSGKNVLFYGFDIESNKYLEVFFKNRAPNSILNIIPFVSNSFLHDNVD